MAKRNRAKQTKLLLDLEELRPSVEARADQLDLTMNQYFRWLARNDIAQAGTKPKKAA